MPTSEAMPIRCERDIVLVRQAVRQWCLELNFSLVDQTKMVTGASELARNTLLHGKGGQMHMEMLTTDARRGLRLVFEDQGPGIPDIAQALQDGYSSKNGLGMGLPGTRRLVNEFNIESRVGVGTKVTIARWKL